MKPWPNDAVMIVAAVEAEFNVSQIRGVPVECECRECGDALLADSWTIARAESMPERRGRPVLFVCLDCVRGYDSGQIDVLEDHRGHKFFRMEKKTHGNT